MTLTPTKAEQMRKAAADLDTYPGSANTPVPRGGPHTTSAEEREQVRKSVAEAEALEKAEGVRQPLTRFRHQRPVTADITGSIRGDIRKALGADDGPIRAPDSKVERVALELLKLAEAYLDATGRDPDPTNPEDAEYYRAYEKIFRRGAGL